MPTRYFRWMSLVAGALLLAGCFQAELGGPVAGSTITVTDLRTGAQVLRTLHMSYESINAGDDRWLDVGVLLLIVFLMKVGYVVVLWAKVTATAAPTAPVRSAK